MPMLLIEMLFYSRPGVVEFLPAVPEELNKGTLTGIKGRSRLTLIRMDWDLNEGFYEVTLNSDIDQWLKVIGKGARKLYLKANETEKFKICF